MQKNTKNKDFFYTISIIIGIVIFLLIGLKFSKPLYYYIGSSFIVAAFWVLYISIIKEENSIRTLLNITLLRTIFGILLVLGLFLLIMAF